MAFFSNSPMTLRVSMDKVMFPVPPGGMTLSYRVAKQPQAWVTFFILSGAVPRLDTTNVWVSSVPSKTGGKEYEKSLKWIPGPYSDDPRHEALPCKKITVMQRKPTKAFNNLLGISIISPQ